MLRLRSPRTRWLAYAIVGVLGLLQVLLFQKIQTVENQAFYPLLAVPSTPVRGPTQRVSSDVTTRQNNGGTTTTTATTGNNKPLSHTQPTSTSVITTRTSHTLFNGDSLPTVTRVQDIESVASLKQPFCLPWNVNSDEWWTHHVLWEVFYQDDSHYCFRRIPNRQKMETIRNIYRNQFRNDCSDPVYKKMWNSGFSNDLRNLVDGLAHSTQVTHRPFQVTTMPWHYASPKPFNISTAACKSQDMFCYFLPLSNCPRVAVNDTIKQIGFLDRGVVVGPKMFNTPTRWYLEYVSRPQTWLRHRVYQFVKQQNIQAPCTALHVRRGDVITHGSHARRYFSIAEYLSTAGDSMEHNILLLTDDHNAIGEALHEFPAYNWMYIDRPRYRGSEGGFEHHLPSNDPILEMTVLLGTFHLVRRCTSMVRSSSAFGDYLWGEIKDEHQGDKSIWWKRVDENSGKIFSQDNIAISANVSKTYDILL